MLLMHGDTIGPERLADWGMYLDTLRTSGGWEGGSSIAAGSGHRKIGTAAPTSDHLVGYLLLTADSLDDARGYLGGNPVYEAGGTVEIRELMDD